MAKILLITAGWEQKSLIRTAKEMGHKVIATHSKDSAEGFKYADKRYIVDPKNLLKLYDISLSENIDGVVTDQCDYSYFATSYISERLGLPGPNLKTAQIITNKERVRRKITKNNRVLQPKFRKCESYKETVIASKQIGFPVIIKPTDNRGSIGVAKINNEKELKKAYMIALAKSNAGNVLIEKFIPGDEIAVDGYFFKNKGHKILNITSEKHYEKKLVNNEIITPPEISEKALKKVNKMNSQIVDTLEIGFGATHIEYIITSDDEVYFIEAHNRGGGIRISDKVNPLVSGIDSTKCLIFDCLDEKYKNISLDENKNHVLIKFISLPIGEKFLSVELKNKEKVKDFLVSYKIYAKKGEPLPDIKNGATRHGFIIVSGDSKKDLYNNFQKVYNQMEFNFV